MKLRNLRMERSPKLMIIPMIDIIFFLLVFFMMSTLYMTEQNVIPVSLPSAAASKNDKEAMIPITVTAQGTIMVYQEDIPRELLAARVKKELMQKEDMWIIHQMLQIKMLWKLMKDIAGLIAVFMVEENLLVWML